ncbi:hypothetical protein C8R43DRAFT_120570 [Mycena crocata]|nr:hypothetical protein C8R43DRAFT_120570 [Mycena crocata]
MRVRVIQSMAGSESAYNLQRGAACSNCRRRKVKCDGTRPVCNQCHLRPPRSRVPCVFDLDTGPSHQSTSQMQETIRVLKMRIEQLERSNGGSRDPEIFLHTPYGDSVMDPNYTSTSVPSPAMSNQEPPSNIATTLIHAFLTRFNNSGYFFLDAGNFSKSALLSLPFGHPERPSKTLLHAVYLWGSLVLTTPLPAPYTEEILVLNALQTLREDIRHLDLQLKLVMETIQAEVLLGLYYLHAERPVEGRYHTAAAVSLALTAGLHRLSHHPVHQPLPPFLLAHPLLLPARNAGEVGERIGAFWAVAVLNNYWVAADGCSSIMPYGTPIDTPWHASPQSGATITKFLNGHDQDGHSPVTLLTKASILVERIVSYSARVIPGTDPAGFNALDTRLHTFQASLPHISGSPTLLMVHALTDLAIVRLHAPFTHSSDAGRYKCLMAANRVVANMSGTTVSHSPRTVDPMFGPVCATVCAVYLDEIVL